MRVSVDLLKGHIAVGQQEQAGILPLDRPVDTGGTGMGFNGGHLMLLGWGACFKSSLVAAAEARELPVEKLRLLISGETEAGPYRFVAVAMNVELEGPPSHGEKEKLIQIAAKGCAVSNTLRNAVDMKIALAE